jgi:hypothetical protein
MVMMPPVRGWEPWRRGRFRRVWRRWRLWLDRRECKNNEHFLAKGFMRDHRASRYYVELTVCRRCHSVLDAEGRKAPLL